MRKIGRAIEVTESLINFLSIFVGFDSDKGSSFLMRMWKVNQNLNKLFVDLLLDLIQAGEVFCLLLEAGKP